MGERGQPRDSLVPRAAACALLALGSALVLAPAASADSNLGTAGGLTYMAGNSASFAAGASVSVDVSCPAGMRVTGGGVAPGSDMGFGAVRIVTTRPADGNDGDGAADDGWLGKAYNGSTGTQHASAYAICKEGGGISYRSRSIDLGPSSGGAATVECPSGTDAAGGGAATSGDASLGWLSATHPVDGSDAGGAPDDGWRGRTYNSAAVERSLTVHAVCLDRDLRYGTDTTDTSYIAFPECPGTSHATGGGGKVSAGAGVSHAIATYPFAEMVNPPDDGWVAAFSFPADSAVSGSVACKP